MYVIRHGRLFEYWRVAEAYYLVVETPSDFWVQSGIRLVGLALRLLGILMFNAVCVVTLLWSRSPLFITIIGRASAASSAHCCCGLSRGHGAMCHARNQIEARLAHGLNYLLLIWLILAPCPAMVLIEDE